MLDVNPIDNSITMDQGDTFDPQFAIVSAAGAPLDVTGATFALTVKKSIDDAIGSALFQLTTAASQFDVSGQTGGIIKALGPASYTQGVFGDYVYDLHMTLAGNTRTPVKATRLRIRKVVTTQGSVPAPPSPNAPFPGSVSYDGIRYALGPDGLYHKYALIFDANNNVIESDVGTGATPGF